MTTNFRVFVGSVILACAAPQVSAAGVQGVSIAEIVKLARAIPTTSAAGAASNIQARMKDIGLTITGGRAYSYDSKSELEQPSDKVGDLHFTIQATQPSPEFKQKNCDMSGDADFLRRSGKFYPENRTANWLMKGQCSTRFVKPR